MKEVGRVKCHLPVPLFSTYEKKRSADPLENAGLDCIGNETLEFSNAEDDAAVTPAYLLVQTKSR